jgi:hypothetical protein
VERLSNSNQQFCIVHVHGIQLVVRYVLYTTPSTSTKTIFKGISYDENSSESDDANDEDKTTDDDTNMTNHGEEDFFDGLQVVMSEKDNTK